MPRHDHELVPTRASLIGRLKNWQDELSWQEFFKTYWKLIFTIARRSGMSNDEAQDIVQETMLAVAKHMPSFKYDPAIGSFKSWLFTLTRWRIRDQFRKRKNLIIPSPDAPDAVEELIDPAGDRLQAIWDAEWEKNLLDAALAKLKSRLSPAQYQLFDLYVNKSWQPEKIASTLGVSVGQVYLAKHRITEMIKAEVTRLEKEIT